MDAVRVISDQFIYDASSPTNEYSPSSSSSLPSYLLSFLPPFLPSIQLFPATHHDPPPKPHHSEKKPLLRAPSIHPSIQQRRYIYNPQPFFPRHERRSNSAICNLRAADVHTKRVGFTTFLPNVSTSRPNTMHISHSLDRLHR